jgi:CubicO group peptidase (beta-lactamase class C family)
MKRKSLIKKILKFLSYTILVFVIGISFYIFRPWKEAQGWRFYSGINPFAERGEAFMNWDKVSKQVHLKASYNPRKYERELTDLQGIDYEYNGKTYTAVDYFNKANLTGLMVLTDNKIVVENYREDMNKETTYHIWSATKSFTATVLGIALKEGKVESFDERVDKYATQFKGTVYGETPIKHVLMMSSGIDFTHGKGKYDRKKLYFDLMIKGKSFDDWVAEVPRRVESGTDFNYAATDTHVLSRVVEGAYNKPYIDVVQEKLWSPGGFTSDAQWSVDSDGNPFGQCCLSLTLQDFAHLGQIYLEDLIFKGESVVSKDWLNMVQNAQASFQEPWTTKNGRYVDGYSIQWWLPVNYNQEFIARGASGQYLYVNKKDNYVVAQFSARGNVSTKEEIAFYRAVGKHFKEQKIEKE